MTDDEIARELQALVERFPALGYFTEVCRVMDRMQSASGEAILLALYRVRCEGGALPIKTLWAAAASAMPHAFASLREQLAMDKQSDHQTPIKIQ